MISLQDLDSETLIRFKELTNSQAYVKIFVPWIQTQIENIEKKILTTEENANERRESRKELQKILQLPEQIVEIIKERRDIT